MDLLLAGGHRLEIAWHTPGASDAPTLVFLHEGLGCVAAWREFPASVSEATGLRSFVYSRLGYGGSDAVPLPRPLDYMEREAALLPEILHVAGIREAILVGHSDGGSIALLYGAMEDARVHLRGLVLESPHVFVEDASVAAITKARDEYDRSDLKERLSKYHGANVDGAFKGWNRAWLDPAFRTWNIEATLPRQREPMLVIQGADDPYGTLAQVDAIERGSTAPVRRFILPACGHSPHRDKPVETIAAIREFVDGLQR